MRVGVTGASGFIGKNLIKHLKSRGECEVFALDGDVLNAEAVSGFTCNTLVHLAGVNRSESSLDLLDANVLGTYNVARHCLKKNIRLLVAGSVKKDGIYGASKSIARNLIVQLANNGLYGTYIDLCNVYGPNCKPFYNSFASTLMWSVVNNQPYSHLIHNGNEVLRLVHVQHVAEAIEILLPKCSFEKFGPHAEPDVMNEFYITINDFVRLLNGTRPNAAIKKRDEELVMATLEWYRKQTLKPLQPGSYINEIDLEHLPDACAQT